MDVGEASAIGDEVFHPKNEVSLFGPGDRGVFVMIEGSWYSLLGKDRWSALICKAAGRSPGCNDIVDARCGPALFPLL